MVAAFPDLRVTVEEVICQGSAVAVRWIVTATHEGAGLELQPSGKEVRVRGMTCVHIRDGQIVEGWDCWNLGGLMQQLNGK